ncbi:MAG: peptidase M23 [Bacteroidetes bacterium]|nr:MAG: peptidase M23 [Bacteroidota bacterium]
MKGGFASLSFFVVCVVSIILFGCGDAIPSSKGSRTSGAFSKIDDPLPIVRFGLYWDSLVVDSGVIKNGQSLSHLLDPYKVGAGKIATLAANSRNTYEVRDMRAGKRWWVATRRDSLSTPAWLIYERNSIDYVVFSLGDTLGARLGSYPVDTVYSHVKGEISRSLYLDLEEVGAPTNLAVAMAGVYAWTIDFTHVQKGDKFDVYYSRKRVNGNEVGMPTILSCSFNHHGTDLLAYRFDQGDGADYFDPQGASLRKAFLKSPVEFSRISSSFNKKRFHPVLKRIKPHLGTDYAAKTGTPILAVGDGVVIKSAYTKNNGNYVKIRHNNTYETQYLHMSKRKCSVGDRVRQGEVIGLVGSTGLATGPHVCFRFWKNGEQVDHRQEKFPPSTPVRSNAMDAFAAEVRRLEAAAKSIELSTN